MEAGVGITVLAFHQASACSAQTHAYPTSDGAPTPICDIQNPGNFEAVREVTLKTRQADGNCASVASWIVKFSVMQRPTNPQPLFLPDSSSSTRIPSAQDIMSDHRARVLREADEREQRRQQQLNEQRLTSNPPNARIRAWEKAHGLRLPTSPTHPILVLIASDTALTVNQIHEEQQARKTPGA